MFIAYLRIVEKRMNKIAGAGIRIGQFRIATITYADDLVLLTNDTVVMNQMLRVLKTYLNEIEMELSVKKSKMMVFGEPRGRKKKNSMHWWWGNEEIEEVKEFSYLGYTFSKDNSPKAHIEKKIRKAKAVLGRLWSLGERNCKNSWDLRIRMFDAVAKSILLYGAELYGWSECQAINVVQMRYVKWVLGLSRQTPSVLMRAETGIQKPSDEALVRAISYEDRCAFIEQKFREIIYEKRRTDQRKVALQRLGWSEAGIDEEREKGWTIKEEARNRIRGARIQNNNMEIDKLKQREEIKKLYLNRSEAAEYLKKNKRLNIKMIARFWLGNEWRGSKKWLKEKDRRCRLCDEEEENLGHIQSRCKHTKREGRNLLDPSGRWSAWMYEILWKRKRKTIDASDDDPNSE